MVRRQHALLDVVAKDPDVASYGTGLGGSRPVNNGFVVIGLKPRDQRSASADQIINRLRPQLAKVPGATLFMQAAQDLNVGGRTSRTQYQYTLQDSDINELNDWAPKLLAQLQKLPMLRDVASDQQTSSGMLSLTIDRDQAARFGIQPAAIDQALYDAFGQRQAAQFFTQSNSYHVVLEITPALQSDPASLDKLYLKSALTGQMVPLSAMTKYDTQHVTYLSINHQGQFPAVTLSFNLAPGAALGDAVNAITRASVAMRLPATITGNFQGTAQAFQSSLKSQPYLILAALVAVYIILGMLYESYIHPLTILSTLPSAGVGALLVLLHVAHRSDRDGLDRHHLVDRHRQEKRHHDGRFRHPGGARAASVLARRDSSGLLAALSSDHDDHDGGIAGCAALGARPRHRVRAAPTAGLHHGRRPDFEPGIDAVHHAGHLPVPG